MASHSSGIPTSEALRTAFVDASRNSSKRVIKAQIVNEEIALVADLDETGTFEDDLDRAVELLEPKEACYLLVRTDDAKSDAGHSKWLLCCYVPDGCKVRDKMVYASSRAALKLSLGGGLFAYDVFGTVKGDFNKAGFAAYLRMQKSAAPLTESEQAKNFETMASAAEASAGRAVSPTGAMVHGVSFEASDEARKAVTALVGGGADNYVQLSIDEDKELIVLKEKARLQLEGLADRVPLDRPAFHFLRYDHEFEGASLSSIVYVYSCPDGSGRTTSAPVKARMLFSSCKGGVESIAGPSRVDLRLEINDGTEVGAEAVLHKLHPPPVAKKETFAKPKPAGKGPKRLIR